MQAPFPHRLAHGLRRFISDSRIETDKVLTLRVLRSPGPKRIAQEIELLLRIVLSPPIILAVDNSRLLPMKFQSTFSKPPLNRRPKTFGLGFTLTMANPIIRIPLERDLRILSLHPLIERIMQKEIRKEGTDDSSLRNPFLSMNQATILQLHRCFQPSLNVQKHPFAIRMLPHRPHQQINIDTVEEAFNIEV